MHLFSVVVHYFLRQTSFQHSAFRHLSYLAYWSAFCRHDVLCDDLVSEYLCPALSPFPSQDLLMVSGCHFSVQFSARSFGKLFYALWLLSVLFDAHGCAVFH